MARKTLTLYLLKADVTDYAQALSSAAQEKLVSPATRVVDAPEFANGARLYVFVGNEGVPTWLRDLRGAFDVPGRIQTSSCCAVLVFNAHDRFFASTFAHGWTYLEETNVEGDFGLRVSLNGLNEKKLKRLERANLGDALRGISQSPFQRDFASFGMDDSLDLIRRLSGQAREGATADAMSGSKSLRVTGDYEIQDLPDIAGEALEYYASILYRDSDFRVIDFVTPVTDSRLITSLDDMAAASIREDQEEFELGLPIAYTDDSVSYKFMGPGLRGSYPDLLLRQYVLALGENIGECDAQTIRDHKVVAQYEDDRPPQKWSIRTALVGSLVYEGGRYAINEGEWYRLDEAFKTSIEETFQGLREEWDAPPTPLRKIYDAEQAGRYQSEASYNQEWAEAAGFVLLDTHEIEVPGVRRSRFEPCDLLDIQNKKFIHVKKSSRRSNVLSHFFKQGSNSAQQFKRFPATWDELQAEVEKRSGRGAARRLRGAIRDEERKWKVEFVIADTPRVNGQFNIPFFSKISLRDESVSLRAMGYEVGIKFIGLEPDVIPH